MFNNIEIRRYDKIFGFPNTISKLKAFGFKPAKHNSCWSTALFRIITAFGVTDTFALYVYIIKNNPYVFCWQCLTVLSPPHINRLSLKTTDQHCVEWTTKVSWTKLTKAQRDSFLSLSCRKGCLYLDCEVFQCIKLML